MGAAQKFPLKQYKIEGRYEISRMRALVSMFEKHDLFYLIHVKSKSLKKRKYF
jgi:hypothetical protein